MTNLLLPNQLNRVNVILYGHLPLGVRLRNDMNVPFVLEFGQRGGAAPSLPLQTIGERTLWR
jgi:hypothetical protein